MHKIGRPDLLEGVMGLTDQKASLIGAIIIFAGNVEYRLERAIWRLQSHSPRGVRHATDSKPIGELIVMFEVAGAALPSGPQQQLVELWCATARIAFDFRHTIAHGIVFRPQFAMSIERNRSWQGELRKRPPASLWGDAETFENIRLTFAVLLQVIISVGNDKRKIDEVASSDRLEALSQSKLLMEAMVAAEGPWL